MDHDATQSTGSGLLSGAVCPPLERQILALDALAKLTKQFSKKPDFEQLIDVLLMTLCGQFSTGDSFALLLRPSPQGLNQSFFATGRFRKKVLLTSMQMAPDDWRGWPLNGCVYPVKDLKVSCDSTGVISILQDCGVSLICPLVHNEKFFGIIGIGHRVTGKPYKQEDIDLLNSVINTITPLVANSYLFWEIAGLNAWYLDILNSVRQGVFVFDRNHRLKKINSAGLDIIRTFRPQDSEMSSLLEAPIEKVFPEPIFGGWAKQLVEAKVTKTATAIDSVVARGAGTERIYNVSITGSVENAEIGTALIVTLDDVTVQKENEHRLFDLQKFADKGLMASSISHELNNFLALILGGVEIIEAAMESDDRKKVATTLEKLKVHIRNMERFTAGLMDYARLKVSKQSSNLNSVIKDVLSFLSVQKRFKRIVITRDLDCELPDFRIDGDQIAQLMLNLLNNAADAIDQAGREDGEITITTKRDGGDAVLIISDNGIGMRPEMKERLFKSHFTTKQRGHGYGLVTCAKIVDNHSGSIDVDSTPGEGTTFSVRFPILTEPQS